MNSSDNESTCLNNKAAISVAIGFLLIALVLLSMGAANPIPYARNKWSTNTTGTAWHNFWVDAGAMCPSTNPPEAITITNGAFSIVSDAYAFDDTVDQSVQWKLAMPDIWRGNGYIRIKVYCTTEEAAGTMRWLIQAGAASHDDPMALSLSTSYWFTNTVTAANDLLVSSGNAIGVAGSPVLGDLVFFKLTRDTSVGDTVAGDMYLLGVSIQYGENGAVWAEWVPF